VKEFLVCSVALWMAVLPVSAAPLNPLDFTSLGALPDGDVVINTTDTPTVNGNPAGVVVAQADSR